MGGPGSGRKKGSGVLKKSPSVGIKLPGAANKYVNTILMGRATAKKLREREKVYKANMPKKRGMTQDTKAREGLRDYLKR